MSQPGTAASYVTSIVTLYLEMPDTPMRVSVSDQWLARHLHQDGVPLETVETALLLGSLRRLIVSVRATHLFCFMKMWLTWGMSETVGRDLVRRRRSRAEAELLAREFEASGLTRRAFCSQHGLSVAALDKYRQQQVRRIAERGGRMVPVEVVTGLATPSSHSGSELWLELPNGWRIGVGSSFDGATLKRLVAALVEA